jgi:hypothetical protein
MSDTPKRSLDGENVSHLAEVRRPTTSAVAQSQASEKLHRACFAGLCGIGALSLMGCSSLASEVHDFQEGWRTADVLEIGSAHSIRRGGRTDCRTSADSAALSAARFARISYRAAGSRHAHVILLSGSTSLAVGDVIYTNIARCGTAVQIRAKVAGSVIDAALPFGSPLNPNF